jgi:hypothetical protein
MSQESQTYLSFAVRGISPTVSEPLEMGEIDAMNTTMER